MDPDDSDDLDKLVQAMRPKPPQVNQKAEHLDA